MFKSVFTLALFTLALGGCGVNSHIESIDKSAAEMSAQTKIMAEELQAYREYIKAITAQMQAMSEAIVALQKLGDSAVNLILQRLLAPTPTPTPPGGLGDLFPGPAPQPSASPSVNAL